MTSALFQDKKFHKTVIQVYVLNSNGERAEVEWFYEDLQDLLELTPKKGCPFHYRGLECKSRKSRDTWSNRQIWPWCTKWRRSKANRVLPWECTGHNKHPLLTTQRILYKWTLSDGQYQNQSDYVLCSPRWRRFIQSAKTRLGADCSSDHEQLIAKFRLKLKKVGKTTGTFRYELSQIPYSFTVEVTNRFQGLDLIECLKNYGQRFMTLQEEMIKTITKKKKCKKAK